MLKKKKIVEKSELSEMARTLGKGGRVLACTNTGSEDPPWRAPVFVMISLIFS
jgi:hypothetical protein